MVQPVILAYNPVDVIEVPITGTEVIVAGDLVKCSSSGYIYAMTSATNADSTFVGVAIDSSTTDETEVVTVATKCELEIDATSASYRVGAQVEWTSDNAVVARATTTLGWVTDQTGSAVATRIKIRLDSFLMSGKWEKNH